MSPASSRFFLSVLLLGTLVVSTEALWGAALVGGGATAFLYATGAVALGPVGIGALFLGSTFGAQYLGNKIDEETKQQRLAETQIHRLHWTNCSIPATFRTYRTCSSRRRCDDKVVLVGSFECNACGADALTARKWSDPLDTSNFATDAVCMDNNSRAVYPAPKDRTPFGYWNCSSVPHFAECRRCGSDVAFAKYEPYLTVAGLTLTCVRTNGFVDKMII